MDSDKYLEGQSMQRPPLFESDSFIYWKNRFETYVKSKDLDLWHVITNGDFQPIIQNPETKLDEVVPFENQTDDLKRRLAKNNEAKMVIYNVLPRKEYERIFMCNTAKEIWKTLLITHQGSWSDSGEENDEKIQDETCLVAQAPNEVCSESSYFSDENSSIDDLALDNEYDKLCKMSLKIITKNKRYAFGVAWKPDEWITDIDAQAHAGNQKLFPLQGIQFRLPFKTPKDYLTKFDPKSYEGVFLGYSQNSKAYIILNKHTRKIKESLNVTFDETPPPSKTSPLVDDDLDEEEAIREIEKKNLENVVEDETLEIDKIVNIKESRNHPLENVIGNLNQRTLRSQAQNQSNFFCFISTIEPKNVNEALGDKSWIVAMQEELNQFIANDVWELVPQSKRDMKI
ncbi:retrovirus-related pol polyprotein from transposon TNT 1-94 [Tanacetum coccineum]